MKKIIIVALALVLLVACNGKEEKTYTEELFEHKVEYIGNNSEVGGLLDLQTIPSGGFELKTDEKPYGVIINTEADLEDNKKLEKEAYELLGLIKNADFVSYKNGEEEKVFQLKDAELILGYSPKEFYEDIDKLEEFENSYK